MTKHTPTRRVKLGVKKILRDTYFL
jgi:hypothetical protein